MSTSNVDQLQMNAPRTIWVSIMQLLYTIVAMLPIYYYLREIIQLDDQSQYVLLLLPVVVASLLYFVEIKMNNYFWYNEKFFNQRDIFTSALKSTTLVLGMFYFFYLLVFGYWFSGTPEYENLGLSDKTGRTLTEALVSVAIVASLVIVVDRIRVARTEI